MHKLEFVKKCERTKCDRYIFPQLHPEAEIIGRAVFIQDNNTQEMCSNIVRRDDKSLFLCKLCLLRSQNPYLARRMLADYKEADDAKQVEEEAAKNVLGITLVTKNTEQINVENEDQTNATSNNNIDVKDVIGNVGDDEESDEELNKLADIINTFTPARLKIRAIPKEAKVIGIKTTLRQNDGSMNSSVIPHV